MEVGFQLYKSHQPRLALMHVATAVAIAQYNAVLEHLISLYIGWHSSTETET